MSEFWIHWTSVCVAAAALLACTFLAHRIPRLCAALTLLTVAHFAGYYRW